MEQTLRDGQCRCMGRFPQSGAKDLPLVTLLRQREGSVSGFHSIRKGKWLWELVGSALLHLIDLGCDLGSPRIPSELPWDEAQSPAVKPENQRSPFCPWHPVSHLSLSCLQLEGTILSGAGGQGQRRA